MNFLLSFLLCFCLTASAAAGDASGAPVSTETMTDAPSAGIIADGSDPADDNLTADADAPADTMAADGSDPADDDLTADADIPADTMAADGSDPADDDLTAAADIPADTMAAGGSDPADSALAASEAALSIQAPSVILMEASTGTVIYEKNAHEAMHPASITKIMTLLLIFDALESGKISLSDTVTVSEYAASMGGSQVYLETGETQTVETMIKCISVASANDACVAMAEHLCGSESEFVRQMNERAKGLGMNDTTFVNCCGLDVDGHMTSAHDVALMSRELTVRHPEIHQYSMIWMENITHTTAKGSSEFGLANTNKLIRQYQYATGLKTGFTSLAKYCVSATAKKDDMELIAVIMGAPDPKARTADATTLLNYGFGQCHIFSDPNRDELEPVAVEKGIAEYVNLVYASPFSYVSTDGSDLSGIEKAFELPESAAAPVKKGGVAGRAVYTLDGREIGSVNLLYTDDVPVATYKDYFLKALSYYLT